MSDWLEDDDDTKVDLRLWKKLLRYTLHYRRTAITFMFVAFGLAATDLCFPLLTGYLITDILARGTEVHLAGYAWAYAGLSIGLCACIWGFIGCAGKIRTHVSHDIRRDAFEQLSLSVG